MSNIQIPVTENGLLTLATAGKYCDSNVEIDVGVYSSSEITDSYYNVFWNAYQSSGNRTTYYFAFAGVGWTATTFRPRYQITPKNSAKGIFRNFNGTNSTTDLTKLVNFRELKPQKDDTIPLIDWKGATNLTEAFYNAKIYDVGYIDATNCSTLDNTFVSDANTSLKGCIVKIELKVKSSTTYTNPIANQVELTDLIFVEGSVIGNSGWDLSGSPKLSKESLVSIVNALSSSVSNKSIKFSAESIANNFSQAEWEELRLGKSKWIFNYDKEIEWIE